MLNNSLLYHISRRAEDIEHVLRERVALLPGVRDREDRPIIFVPARELTSHPDHLRNLLTYLHDVTQDEAKSRGFTIVIDMRRGTTWEIVKPILKILQECFPAPIKCVYIVKPDKFLEKYKISTAKYKFDIQTISLEAMPKYIDFCQIIREFGGSMSYDHDEWIELRKDIERVLHGIYEILKNFDRISTEMDNAEMPIDVQSSEASIAKHQDLYPIITAVPIDEFTSEIQSLRNRVIISGHKQSVGTRNGSTMSSPNPDLLAVFPQMEQLLQHLVNQRNIVYAKWDYRKKDLDRYFQLKLFEKDADKLSKWICSQKNMLKQRFMLIGQSEAETNRLLKEHNDFADSVHTFQVSYEQVITVSHRLQQQFQFLGMNGIEDISKHLQTEWAQFTKMIEQRTTLLQTALNMHRKSDTFLKNAEHWLSNVGVDPNFIQSEDELHSAVQKHHEFQKLYESAFSEASDETKKLAKVLKSCFGESLALRLPTWELAEQQSRQIMHKRKELESIWKARNVTIHSKASSPAFNQDLNSVLNWLTEHGEPFMRRKIGIGFDRTTAAQFCETHDKFRAVAHNTHRNAEEIFHAAQKIIPGSSEPMRTETIKRVDELRRRIEKFRKCIEHRTNLLAMSSSFFLHYDEIMQWYSTMDNRINYIRIVPESVQLCEQMKEKFQSENEGTLQAHERVIVETGQLLHLLSHQRELLEVDNTEAIALVQKLTRDIENRHQFEKKRWHEQRDYLSAAMKISTFLRDCSELNSQLEYWRQDLEGLRHSVTKSHEVIQQYHNENTVKVKQCVSDAMKQLDDILQLIHAKNLQLVCAIDPSQPLKDTITAAANRLFNLEQQVMHIAMDVSNQIELTIHLNNLCQTASGVIGEIERDQMSLMQQVSIPGNEQELELEIMHFQQFRLLIEMTDESVIRFHAEKDTLLSTPLLALELHAETRVQAENLCTVVKTKWQALVGMMESRWKLLRAAQSFYKYTKMLLPTSKSIEKDLLGDREKHFCSSRDWDTLHRGFEAIQERIEKHREHKERFMEASVYAQQTADQFIRQIRRCEAPRDHMELRLFNLQEFKDTVRGRQAFIFELWKSTNEQLEHCRDATKILLMAKEVVDWSDREMVICAKIKHSIEQFNSDSFDRAKIEEMLEHCLAQWDLVKMERCEMRKLLQETKHFMERPLNELHLAEIKNCCSLAQKKFKNIWEMVIGCEQTVRAALNFGEMNIQRGKSEQEKLNLDRFSDSTIEEKLSSKEEGTNEQNEENRKILEPMKELLKSEKDYIEDLKRFIEIYLYAYQTSGSMCPMAIRGKEREIFGNIEEIYQFHHSVFLNQLMAYAMNPEDVGYCFIEWMEKLKELYTDYCLNMDENNYLISLPETKKMFDEVREQNGLEISHDLQSLAIKPVQRMTKYHILLNELLKHCTKNAKEIKNVYEIVLSIPKIANDRLHLKWFESSQDVAVGDFVMQDTFTVSEPKRYFKWGADRELQVFLFESNIVFTKKEDLGPKKHCYVYKDSILLREFHVVEHIEGDNSKFGLRKSAFPYQNDQNTTVLKAPSEAIRIAWVKMLRDMKLVMDRQQKISETSAGAAVRSSRDSQSSLSLSLSSSATPGGSVPKAADERNSAQKIDNSAPLIYSANDNQKQQQQVVFRHEAKTNGIDNGGVSKPDKQWMVAEDFTADRPDQLTVISGQRVELLSNQGDHGEFVRVTLFHNKNNNNTASSSVECPKATGFVPRRILVATTASMTTECDSSSGVCSHSPADETHSMANALSSKRTSFRRFFSPNQSTTKSSSSHHRPPSNPNVALDLPCSSSLNQSSASTSIHHSLPVVSTSGVDHHHPPASSSSPPPDCQQSSSLSSHPSSSTTATTTFSRTLHSSSVSTRTIDPDLPPPMNHLSSAVGTIVEAVNGGESTQQPSTSEMADEFDNTNNACSTTEEATSCSPNAANFTGTPSGEVMSSEESARLKRSYVLQELVDSERTYVQDLASISDGYIASLRETELSEEDREKVKIIFANIEQILDFHKTFFLKEIEKSLDDYEAAGNCFIKYERRLHTFYVKYCQNKPKSDFLVSQDYFEQLFFDVKEKLGHKVALSDLLIKPVQRITKYQLMLSDILKYTHRSGDNAEVLERAHDIMRVVPKACDDMMQVGRLQGFQGNLSAQGRLIFQGTLFISDGGLAQPFKGKERRVFLFEQSVIIAECIPPRKEYGNPTYNFKNQIMVNKMVLDEKVSDEPLRFVLRSSDPNQQATYVAHAASAEDKDQWLAKLSAQLDQQKTFLNALVDPKRYQNQLANSIGVISLSGKKDSAGSLGTPTSPAPSVSGGTSPTKPLATPHKSSSSKLFGFGKSKS